MRDYHDDGPGSTREDWHDGERWTLTGRENGWTDEEQFAREALDCESYPGPSCACGGMDDPDGICLCDAPESPAYDDEDYPL